MTGKHFDLRRRQLSPAAVSHLNDVAYAAPVKAALVPVKHTPVITFRIEAFCCPRRIAVVCLRVDAPGTFRAVVPGVLDGISVPVTPAPSVEDADRRRARRVSLNPEFHKDRNLLVLFTSVHRQCQVFICTARNRELHIIRVVRFNTLASHMQIRVIGVVLLQQARRNPDFGNVVMLVFFVHPVVCFRIDVIVPAAVILSPAHFVNIAAVRCIIIDIDLYVCDLLRFCDNKVGPRFMRRRNHSPQVVLLTVDPDCFADACIFPFILFCIFCVQIQRIFPALVKAQPVAAVSVRTPVVPDPDILPGPALCFVDRDCHFRRVRRIQCKQDILPGLCFLFAEIHLGAFAGSYRDFRDSAVAFHTVHTAVHKNSMVPCFIHDGRNQDLPVSVHIVPAGILAAAFAVGPADRAAVPCVRHRILNLYLHKTAD